MVQGGGRTDAAGDTVIVRAAIHPAIGIGRVGNSPDQFFCGPEVSYPTPRHPGFYRDANGALKRQAARFRIYGYNAAGDVMAELTTANSSIAWSAQLRNEKAAWYEFQLAMDIPEIERAKPANRRNAEVKGEDRTKLMIDGDTVAIAGASQSGPAYRFNGEIFGIPVYLGELQTDAAGRLIVLGGQGVSASYAEQPLKDFSNNDTWYDDTADGPVTAGDDRRHDGAGGSRMGRDRPAELRPEPEDRAHDVRSAVRPVCAVRPAAGAEPGLVHPRHPADLPTDERAPVGQRRVPPGIRLPGAARFRRPEIPARDIADRRQDGSAAADREFVSQFPARRVFAHATALDLRRRRIDQADNRHPSKLRFI